MKILGRSKRSDSFLYAAGWQRVAWNFGGNNWRLIERIYLSDSTAIEKYFTSISSIMEADKFALKRL